MIDLQTSSAQAAANAQKQLTETSEQKKAEEARGALAAEHLHIPQEQIAQLRAARISQAAF